MDSKYIAFISYNKSDVKVAELVQHRLEHFKTQGSHLNLQEKLSPVFRDITDLDSGILSDEIYNALEGSKYLIVICSPNSAKSQWVSREVDIFISLGRIEYIIPLIIDGEPNSSDPSKECFPESLRKLSGNQELLGININDLGREAAIVKIISRMLRIPFDNLWHRIERRQKARRRSAIIILSFLVCILTAIIGYVYSLNRDLKINHSRYVAENADQMISEEGLLPALKLLLQVSPVYRPYSFEVEKTIRNLYHKFSHEPYVHLYSQVDRELLSYEVIGENDILTFTACGLQLRDIDSFSIKDSINFDVPSPPVKCSVIDSQSSRLVSFSISSDIYVCEIKDGDIASFKSIGTHADTQQICFLHDGSQIVTISRDCIRIWDIVEENQVVEFDMNSNAICTSAISDTGLLAVSLDDGHIRVYDLQRENQHFCKEFDNFDNIITSLAFKPGTDNLFCSTKEKAIYSIKDIRRDDDFSIAMQNSTNSVNHIMFSPNGKYLISVSDRYIRVWDTHDMNEMSYSPIDNVGSITTISVDRKSEIIVTGAFDGNIRVWEMTRGENIITQNHSGWTTSVDFNEDNTRIISLASDMSVNCWSGPCLNDTMCIKVDTLKSSIDYSHQEYDKLSPDGKFVVSVVENKIFVESSRNGKMISICEGHRGKINSVAFSPDSKILVSGGSDGMIRFWNVDNGEEMFPSIEGHDRSVVDVQFNSNMTEVISVSLDRTRKYWPIISYRDLLGKCQEITKNIALTEEDLKKYYIKLKHE